MALSNISLKEKRSSSSTLELGAGEVQVFGTLDVKATKDSDTYTFTEFVFEEVPKVNSVTIYDPLGVALIDANAVPTASNVKIIVKGDAAATDCVVCISLQGKLKG